MGDGDGYECRSEGLFSGTKQSRRAGRAGRVGCAGFTYESQKAQSTASVSRLGDRNRCWEQKRHLHNGFSSFPGGGDR